MVQPQGQDTGHGLNVLDAVQGVPQNQAMGQMNGDDEEDEVDTPLADDIEF